MNFKKLALATAIVAAPAAGFSLELIDDAGMSDVTGQDGITVSLTLPTAGLVTSVYVHDKNGFGFQSYNSSGVGSPNTTAYTFGGAIVIDTMAIGVGNTNPIVLDIDAGDSNSTSTTPVLNIKVTLPTALTISTGAIRVANSTRDVGATTSFGIGALSGTIMNNMTITLGATTMNIQLGNEVQTGGLAGSDMIVLAGSITGGISMTNFALNDATAGAGAIAASSIKITDNGGTDLTLLADINVVTGGLQIELAQIGAINGAASGMSINMSDVKLGTSSNATIGDVSIVGLNMNGAKLLINGH